ncbi:cell wall-binding repeat-containing protein [Inconstantimicrobium mannanitabidum]|uniref:Uncharacterized protein n=1 Tax=Inconstantimicrobium mannanitabidum TaxID=1604901 RepID=A0ACB5R8X6_9CLOT|nr:cell wall-binding repeat-containing protein [Clostridium sp. TW13]GKX65319.1 hypothetical protein rsdtw13_05770 [Clostridium sp. TW13]
MNNNYEGCPCTLNTTRICGDTPIDASIEVSKIGFADMRPNTVILVNENEVFDGIAASSLVHFPFNAPILYTDGNTLSKKTLEEIQRLSPKGYQEIQVILVGNIAKAVSLELTFHGFNTEQMVGHNHYETATMVCDFREVFDNIIIMSGEDYTEGIASAYWAAHHGSPILYVQKNNIPRCTFEEITKMKNVNVYILGSTKTVSKSVELSLEQIRNVKRVQRIEGNSIYDIAVNFAKYKDEETGFGWDRDYRAGHAFTFGDINQPMSIIAGVVFAHMGKHTPLLLVEKDKVPMIVESYIDSVKPLPPKDMPKPPFMHGFIMGNLESISYEVQKSLEKYLSIDYEMMGMDSKIEIIENVPDIIEELKQKIKEKKHNINIGNAVKGKEDVELTHEKNSDFYTQPEMIKMEHKNLDKGREVLAESKDNCSVDMNKFKKYCMNHSDKDLVNFVNYEIGYEYIAEKVKFDCLIIGVRDLID